VLSAVGTEEIARWEQYADKTVVDRERKTAHTWSSLRTYAQARYMCLQSPWLV